LWISADAGACLAATQGDLTPVQGDHTPVQGDRTPVQGDRKGSPLQLVRAGQPFPYSEETASAIFAEHDIRVTVDLGLGDGQATVWTCDLSHDYVSINGHYRT